MPARDSELRLSGSYWRLLGATGIDNLGRGAYVASVSLLAVTLTQDPRLVSMISTATYLPWLLVSLPAGTLVDRFDRVGVMWRTQAAAAVIVSTGGVMIAMDRMSIAALTIIAFALGSCDVVFSNAGQAVLPDIVPHRLLHRANGNLQAVITVGQLFAGPPLGSALFAVTAALPFGANACSFVVSASLLSTVPRLQNSDRERQPVWVAIAGGLRWLMRDRLMRTLAVLLGLNTFCGQLANAVLVLLATQTLGVGIRMYGVLLASAAVGSILGGLFNARIVQRFGSLPALLAALTVNIVAFIGIGCSPNPVVLGCFLAVNGFATTLWNVVTTTLRQQLVPSSMMGRVNSVYKMLGWGLIPVGTVIGGMVAHELGLRAPYLLAGAIRAVVLLCALPILIPAVRIGSSSLPSTE